jgi:leucyl-tRNA synthetase
VSAVVSHSLQPGAYDFEQIQSRWQQLWEQEGTWQLPDEAAGGQAVWDKERVSGTPGLADEPHGAYYVLQSPPCPRDNLPLGQLRSDSFANALAQYHRSHGRRVFTEYDDCTFDDVRAPDWPERIKSLQRDTLDISDGVELIFGCTQIDEARLLTKTLRRTELMTARRPYVRALALGMVTGDDHAPVTNAKQYIDLYGVDTVRCYMIFMGPHEHDLPWSDGQIGGVHRFLARLWRLAEDLAAQTGTQPRSPVGADLDLLRKTHQTIDHVTETIDSDMRLHVAIAAIMELVSESLRARDQVQAGTIRFAVQIAALLLFPFAPHTSAEVYYRLTGERVWEQPWPLADPAYLLRENIEILVEVDGKLRARVQARYDATPEQLKEAARRSALVREHIASREIKREVVVPGRLVNFVTA